MLSPSQRQQLTQTLRARLCQLRDEMRLTDAAWARLAKVRQQDVSRYTRGAMTYPTLEFLDALASAFQLTLGEVLVERYPNPTQSRILRQRMLLTEHQQLQNTLHLQLRRLDQSAEDRRRH